MVRTAPRYEAPELTAARQTTSLAALAVTLGLVVAGLYLVNTLRAEGALQDCVLEGRTGCR
jgi:hypothetical protein